MDARGFWVTVGAGVLSIDYALARGEPDGNTLCEVTYVAARLDRRRSRTALALGLAGLWLHLTKRRPWLDLKEY